MSNIVKPLLEALNETMKNREEMKARIDELELNNKKLVEELDKMRQENAELKRDLLKMEISSSAKKMTSVNVLVTVLLKIVGEGN